MVLAKQKIHYRAENYTTDKLSQKQRISFYGTAFDMPSL